MSEPQLLLLHGAGLGAWIWDDVLPHLIHPARALDLPGRSDGANPGEVTLEQCIAFVAGQLAPRTILVGHSISAEIAVAAAARAPEQVAALVLVGGMVPESGKPFLSLLPPPMRMFLSVLLRLSRQGVALPESEVRKSYCNDLDDAQTALVLRKVTREIPHIYLDPVDWSALPPKMPRYYVKLMNDRSVQPKDQDKIIDRTRATVVELETGHLPMLKAPADLAAILERVASSV